MTNPTNILRQVLFHPVGALAVEPFHDGDVRHGCGCRGAVPMLLTRPEPDHVTRPNLLDWASPALCQAAARPASLDLNSEIWNRPRPRPRPRESRLFRNQTNRTN